MEGDSADSAAVGPTRRWQLLVPASLAVLLAAADTYVVVVVITSIMAGTGVGVDQLQRATPIVTGFLLGYVALLPLIGRMADRHGRRPVFIGCLVTFALGSAITGSAHSLSIVIAGRAVQGAGGGGLVPVTLSLVAALWAADERGLPLGVVSAVQELGSVLGPLYGAGIVALSGWRTIFWINLPLAALLGMVFVIARAGAQPAAAARPGTQTAAAARPGTQPAAAARPGTQPTDRRLPDIVGGILAVLGVAGVLLALWAPPKLANSVRFGSLYNPRVGGATWAELTTPMAFLALGIVAVFVVWEAVAPRSFRRVVNVRNVRNAFTGVDLPGALLLAGLLACVIVMFSTTDPARQVIASSWPVLTPAALLLLVVLVVHERRVDDPIIARPVLAARPAWGSLMVNFALGGALMATLVAVPLFAGATTHGGSQVSSALVLVRFLVAVPIGALAGGWLCRRFGDPGVAAAGMVVAGLAFLPMTSWGETALSDPLRIGGLSLGFTVADVELVICGLGFGLVIAPVNNAVLRAVPSAWHGLATALTVVARMVGMLVGLSILVAIALRTFYSAQKALGSPLTLCPSSPTNCPAYNQGTTRALIGELHTIFAGAAVCAAIAAIAAVLTLRRLPPPRTGEPAPAEPSAARAA